MWASDSKVIPVVVLTAIFVYVVGVIIMTIALIHYGDENITKTTTTTEKSTITKTCMITMGDQEGPFYESGRWTKRNNPILFHVGEDT